eukprot:CAMPEP_0114658140 /NCGR_PEP_ID=MMETSP0191-20121206/15181_1 /TAXON_ID=126664 /ORGANISM="Sorites sp." /LENGTH=97 /DNA_ID=CAMNT_0001879327 /DNA_START=579 /DNA_END=872 /DNA_ORIENTATION=-
MTIVLFALKKLDGVFVGVFDGDNVCLDGAYDGVFDGESDGVFDTKYDGAFDGKIDGVLLGVFDGDSVTKTLEYIHLFVTVLPVYPPKQSMVYLFDLK